MTTNSDKMRVHRPPAPRIIVVLAQPGAQMLDVAGPLDVFAEADARRAEADPASLPFYRPLLIGTAAGPLHCSSGPRLLPDHVAGDPAIGPIDTLLVAGAPDAGQRPSAPATLDWLRVQAARCRRFGSVCTGALLLAEAGLLDGRRATTHWAAAGVMAERHPEVRLEIDAIHVRDGRLRTAAGVTAGLDLALALVEEDLGPGIARAVAAHLVMYVRRGGGQLQHSRQNDALPAGRSALQAVQRLVAADPGRPHDVDALAAHAGLSPRHFARLFRQEIGVTPAAWVESVRVDAARTALERGEPPKLVANACGFNDVNTMRRAFLRRLGTTPADYRRRHAMPDREPSG
ncbi:GlxA family transcriptional regulator [Rhizosaccharibacter radicis]|uniref:Helix-turn-helix domain-containing protein n=1 Tax=Rhizosaccharibacter radicis TaxID=2782605 RepID=A0ABT1W1E7_9PROT|nr:helix-turn-helix domain-containing protein [Acetobacteraceae bacterium KSS12]